MPTRHVVPLFIFTIPHATMRVSPPSSLPAAAVRRRIRRTLPSPGGRPRDDSGLAAPVSGLQVRAILRALGPGRPARALRRPAFASSPLGPGRPARALRILAFASSLTVVTLAISPFHQASLEGHRVRGAALGCACHGKPFYSFIRFVSHCMSVRSNNS